ncbi:MAG: glycerol-3-phosphate acyltransferase [Alphaproteobacteria bacterium]|nr:glycerol-3-phosphate acyltransferase [Alphaproteobacteria bacterium]
MRVSILGAGPLGQSLAILAKAAGHEVLMGYRPDMVREIPVTGDPAALAAFSELVLLATPGWELATTLEALPLGPEHRAVVCGRGLDPSSGGWLSDLVARTTPALRVGVLAGPAEPTDILAGSPCAMVVASAFREVQRMVQSALHSPLCRVYTSDDPHGVELAAAFARVLALVVGMSEGMYMGPGARGLVVSRGLAEATRLGQALGTRAETFTGLAGLGDLVAASTSDTNLAYAAGKAIAAGRPHHEEVAPRVARLLVRRARDVGVELPLTEATCAILDGAVTPAQAFQELMGRKAVSGGEG